MQTPNKHQQLCEEVNDLPADFKSFDLFTFSNELRFRNTIDFLAEYPPQSSEKIRVAIIIGESNFLSMLPELKPHADVVIMNDINSMMNQHTIFMFNCLLNADSIADFEDEFNAKHPGKNDETHLDEQLDNVGKSLGNKFFLFNQNRFMQCKQAAQELNFVWAGVDFSNPKSVEALTEVLNHHNAIPTVLNLTNIHHYCDYQALSKNVTHILGDQAQALILFSTGPTAQDKVNLKSKVTDNPDFYQDFLFDSDKHANDYYIPSRPMPTNLQEIIDQANQKIAEMAKQSGIDHPYIPKVSTTQQGLFTKRPVICLMKAAIEGDNNNPLMAEKSEALYQHVFRSTRPDWERQWYYDEDESGLADSAELKLENLKRFINPNAMTDLKNQFMTTKEQAVSSAQDKPASQDDDNDKVPGR